MVDLNIMNNMVKKIKEMLNLEIYSNFDEIEDALSFMATTRTNQKKEYI